METHEAPRSFFDAVTLHGLRVRLEPLSFRHLSDLAAAGSDRALWQWLPTRHDEPGAMRAFIQSAIDDQMRHEIVAFATVAEDGRAVGSTRYHCIVPRQRRLEIGVTWIGAAAQRSHVNTEAKYLQLWYAFEVLRCRRVEFKADAENKRSRSAILRLGAKEEGYFRKHMIYPDGRNRDSVYFSIVDDEWQSVRRGLAEKLGYEVNPSFEMR